MKSNSINSRLPSHAALRRLACSISAVAQGGLLMAAASAPLDVTSGAMPLHATQPVMHSSTATTTAPVLLAAPSDADFPRQTPADTASPAASSMVTASCIWDHASRWSLDPLLLLSILMQEGIEPGQCAVNRNGTCDMGPSGINNRPAALQELSRYMNEPHENFEQRLLSDACFNVGAGAAMLHMKIRQAGGDTWKGVAHYNSRTPHIGQAYARKVARHYKRLESYMLETVATSSP